MASSIVLESYDMSGERKALMLCVKENNVGAQTDLQTMETFFNDFGFDAEILIDGSVKQMREKLRSFRDRINRSHENISCVLVVTTSHGDRNVIIDPYDRELPVNEIIQYFDDRKCPKLKGKPKIFMMDACRGSMEDFGVHADKERDYQLMVQFDEQMKEEGHRRYMSTYKSPMIDHMIAFYATKPDFVAYMTSKGAAMFSKMAEVLETADTENEHLRDLFVKVNKKMSDEDFRTKGGIRKNIITIESNLTKVIYLGRRRVRQKCTSSKDIGLLEALPLIALSPVIAVASILNRLK